METKRNLCAVYWRVRLVVLGLALYCRLLRVFVEDWVQTFLTDVNLVLPN